MLNPFKVPPTLRHLIPLAQRFGVENDRDRAEALAKASRDELETLRIVIAKHDSYLDAWLAGPEIEAEEVSDEYAAFTCLRIAIVEC